MNFEEKLDAMRMTLELATHDLESLRARIEEMGTKIDSLRIASASQYDSIQGLMKISHDLVIAAQAHDKRISGLEHRA